MALKKVRAGQRLKGYPADMHNAVVDLMSPAPSVPSDKILNPPQNHFWVWWKNEAGPVVYKGMGVPLTSSFFDTHGEDNTSEDQRNNYARDADTLAFHSEPLHTQTGVPSVDYDPRHDDEGSTTDPDYLGEAAHGNWGFALENILPGKTGRVGVMGLFLVPIKVNHPSMHFVTHNGQHWVTSTWQGPGNGEILWLSETNAQWPTNFSPESFYQDRLAIIRLGSASAGNIICYTTSTIPAMDRSDPTNPEPGIGNVEPQRLGFPLTSPRRRGDVKLHSYAMNWNRGAGLDYESIKAINISEIPIPSGVQTQMDWDSNSRCFVVRPPALQWSAYYTTSGGSPLTWTSSGAVDNLGMSYSSGEFTADQPMRISITASLHMLYSAGTAPFEASFFMERNTGSSYTLYRPAYTPIVAAGMRSEAVLITQLDLSAGHSIRFDWSPQSGPPAAAVSFGDLTIRRTLNA